MRKNDFITKLDSFHNYNIIPESRELFLHGYDTNDSGVDHRMATTFIKNLRILEEQNSNTIVIHQYSLGGDWEAGIAIYDSIKQSPCKFVFICHGVAASMGSIIPQAVYGKGYRVTMPNTGWLIHEGDLFLEGTPTRTKSNLDYMELNKELMYNIYTDACQDSEYFYGQARSKVKAFIKRKVREKTDWCLTGEEAVKYGFADGMFGGEGWENLNVIKKELQ